MAARKVGLLVVLTAAAVVAAPGLGEAASRHAVNGLLSAGCPAYEAIETHTYTTQEQDAALDGRFESGGFHFRLVPPVNWRQNRIHATARRAQLERFAWLDALLYVYRSSPGSERGREALAHARALVLDWLRAARDPHRGIDPIAWRNKVAGDRAPYVGYVARSAACEGMLTRPQAKRLIGSLLRHARFLRAHRHDPSNHGLFVNFGLAALSDYLSFIGRSDRWRHQAERSFAAIVRRRLVGREGVWLEHTTQYQVVVTQLVAAFDELTGGESGAVGQILERMRRATARFVVPDGFMTQFGDSNLNQAPGWAKALVPSQRGLSFMPKSGYAVVSEPQSYLAVGAGFHNGSHKQSDELSFQLFEDGHRVVSDGGRYAIDGSRMRHFAVSARAHSVLTVDDRDFPRQARRAYGSGMVAAGRGQGWYAIQARNPLVRRRGVSHTRLLLYRPDDALVVLDRVRSHQRHRYTRYFQLGSDIDAERDSGGVALSAPGLHGALYDAPVHGHLARLDLVRGRRSPVLGFTFPGFRQAVPRWTARYRNAGKDRDYVATFGFGSSPASATIGEGPGTTIAVSRPGSPVTEVSVTRDGHHLSVAESPGP
jgi:hypothetical protein